jgi:steroid delta-isomerase-like uncharacterized protein
MIERKIILSNFIREVWNAGDASACDRYLAAAYTIHHDPGDAWNGKTLDLDGFKARLMQSRAPFPDQTFTIREMFENDDALAMTWSWTGTHSGEIAGFPASGKTIRMTGATVYYFDGDRLCGHWQIADRLGVFRQLAEGSGPQKSPVES